MKDFWDERYGQSEYIYGQEPNVFFAEQLARLTPGKLLLPAEGEGRNAVFAAQKGWTVTALDYSEEGKKKAEQLAEQHGVSIDYQIADLLSYSFPANQFDAVAFVFAHFHKKDQPILLEKAVQSLQPGGTLIMEVFHHDQIGHPSGGPKTIDLLYHEEELAKQLSQCKVKVLQLEKTATTLAEGSHHEGTAVVVRVVAQKLA